MNDFSSNQQLKQQNKNKPSKSNSVQKESVEVKQILSHIGFQ